VASRALAHEAALAERGEEQARTRRAALDAPWYDEKLDPTNFGANEFLDPQHIAMFNGTRGGRTAASFPERTLDSGLHFNPTPSALSTNSPGERNTVNPLHPEILTDIILDLWTPSTSNGALGQALAVATDAPPSLAGPSEPPLTISPPLDPADLPPPPDPVVFAPEGSSRAKRQADWAAQGDPAKPTPKQPSQDDAAQKRKREQDEQKRQQEDQRKRDEQQRNK
jgi:hypothetical protein